MIYKTTPKLMKRLLNIYGPFLGAGVKVESISDDWREVIVSMKLRWYNKNAVGVHFGGSLYSMTDPHLMLMLMRNLGRDYIVWDKAAEIELVSPGKGKVNARITLSSEQIDEVIEKVESGAPYLPKYEIEVLNESGQVIARVIKTLYIKKKKL